MGRMVYYIRGSRINFLYIRVPTRDPSGKYVIDFLTTQCDLAATEIGGADGSELSVPRNKRGHIQRDDDENDDDDNGEQRHRERIVPFQTIIGVRAAPSDDPIYSANTTTHVPAADQK